MTSHESVPLFSPANTAATRDDNTGWSRWTILVLALLLLSATFLLISPPPERDYPGLIPWADGSILHAITKAMSLGGQLQSARGVEIKDLVFHLAAAAGLLLLGARALSMDRARLGQGHGAAAYAQVLLAAWVLLALFSAMWSGDPALTRGQALLYALSLGWAVAVAGCFERRHLPHLLYGLVVISAVGAILCIWYYYERNPNHRPGFPLGNPNTLGAAIVPAILIALSTVIAGLWGRLRQHPRASTAAIIICAVSLVPLVWCFQLTGSRGATVALVVGIGVILAALAGRWVRLAIAGAFVIGLIGLASWWFSTSQLDVAMARGATVRFRLYAWRYAAELWQSRPMLGHGAGAYPRLAGEFAVRDRALDPAAFMGQLVEHAHNELFEILAEIGLVGGVTFVGGFVATSLAAVILLRRRRGDPHWWLLLALAASLGALAADAMTGVPLRLPGVTPIACTLLGVLWATSRQATSRDDEPQAARNPTASVAAMRLGGGLVCLAAGLGASWIAVENWRGVRAEFASGVSMNRQRFANALDETIEAEARMLDPVRRLLARDRALRCRFALAHHALQDWASPPAAHRSMAARRKATELAADTYQNARWVRRHAPSLPYTDIIAARTAEWLAVLHRESNEPEATEWRRAAELAWHRQRRRTPHNAETLLALFNYRGTVEQRIVLLRDALRSSDADGEWLQKLRQLSESPAFERTLVGFVAVVGPITPQTDLDTLIASMAPEVHRLAGAWHSIRKQHDTAAVAAARAATLYEPMRSRFPKLYSVALGEQAEYLLRADVANAPRSIELLHRAIDALPIIQAQQYARQLRPFRFRLAMTLLADGQVPEAIVEMKKALGEQAMNPEIVEQYLQRLVFDAAAHGVPAERLSEINATLCPDYPTFCPPGAGDTETDSD